MSIGVAGVDLVAAAEADAVGRHLGLFDAPAENPERIRRLTKAVDALRDRFGFTILRRPSSGADAPDAPARTVWVQPPPPSRRPAVAPGAGLSPPPKSSADVAGNLRFQQTHPERPSSLFAIPTSALVVPDCEAEPLRSGLASVKSVLDWRSCSVATSP